MFQLSSRKRPKKTIGSEYQLQIAVVKYLRLKASRDWIFFSIAAGDNKLGAKQGALRKARGVVAGVPDMILIRKRDGATHWIELKAGVGKLSEKQRQFHKQLTNAGQQVATCYSLNDVEEKLNEWK